MLSSYCSFFFVEMMNYLLKRKIDSGKVKQPQTHATCSALSGFLNVVYERFRFHLRQNNVFFSFSYYQSHKNIHINTLFPPLTAVYHIIKLPVQTVTSIVPFNLTAELDSNVLPVVSGSPGCPFILISPGTLCCRGDCLGRIRHCFPDTQASHPNPLIGRHNPPIH